MCSATRSQSLMCDLSDGGTLVGDFKEISRVVSSVVLSLLSTSLQVHTATNLVASRRDAAVEIVTMAENGSENGEYVPSPRPHPRVRPEGAAYAERNRGTMERWFDYSDNVDNYSSARPGERLRTDTARKIAQVRRFLGPSVFWVKRGGCLCESV